MSDRFAKLFIYLSHPRYGYFFYKPHSLVSTSSYIMSEACFLRAYIRRARVQYVNIKYLYPILILGLDHLRGCQPKI